MGLPRSPTARSTNSFKFFKKKRKQIRIFFFTIANNCAFWHGAQWQHISDGLQHKGREKEARKVRKISNFILKKKFKTYISFFSITYKFRILAAKNVLSSVHAFGGNEELLL